MTLPGINKLHHIVKNKEETWIDHLHKPDQPTCPNRNNDTHTHKTDSDIDSNMDGRHMMLTFLFLPGYYGSHLHRWGEGRKVDLDMRGQVGIRGKEPHSP